jgi:hypothetical protein
MPDISQPWRVLVRTDTTMNVVVRVTDANGSGVAIADTGEVAEVFVEFLETVVNV